MKLHWLQHVPFEGLGIIEEWATAVGFEIGCTRLSTGEQLPSAESFDWLVVMGGPMGLHDHDEHPWLVAEKEFIRQSIDAGKTVLGICLGAQLIANVLGAKVYPGLQKEIGWFPIRRSEAAPELLPEELTAFHWHGDTFDLPKGTIRLASSEVCKNEGFVYNDRVVALQFHLETTPESMEALIGNCGNELSGGDDGDLSFLKNRFAASFVARVEPSDNNEAGSSVYIQTAEQIRDGSENIGEINAVMKGLLDRLHHRSCS